MLPYKQMSKRVYNFHPSDQNDRFLVTKNLRTNNDELDFAKLKVGH